MSVGLCLEAWEDRTPSPPRRGEGRGTPATTETRDETFACFSAGVLALQTASFKRSMETATSWDLQKTSQCNAFPIGTVAHRKRDRRLRGWRGLSLLGLVGVWRSGLLLRGFRLGLGFRLRVALGAAALFLAGLRVSFFYILTSHSLENT